MPLPPPLRKKIQILTLYNAFLIIFDLTKTLIMKTNYLKLAALFITLSTVFSCSKDDSSPKVTEQEKPATELTTEQSVELSNANTNFINQMADFSDVLSGFEIPALKGNAKEIYGPDICGIKPLGAFELKTLTYKFEYNFTGDACYLKGKKIYGKITILANINGQISINLDKLITLIDDSAEHYNHVSLTSGGFVAFKSGTEPIRMYSNSTNTLYVNQYYLTKNSDLKSYNNWRKFISSMNSHNDLRFITSNVGAGTESNFSYSSTSTNDLVRNRITIAGSRLRTLNNCLSKGYVSGEVYITNPKNNITINFGDGTCDNNTRTIKTKTETVTVKLTEETPKTFTNDPTPVDLSDFPTPPLVLPGPPPAE